jgi:hypothetical protein
MAGHGYMFPNPWHKLGGHLIFELTGSKLSLTFSLKAEGQGTSLGSLYG